MLLIIILVVSTLAGARAWMHYEEGAYEIAAIMAVSSLMGFVTFLCLIQS